MKFFYLAYILVISSCGMKYDSNNLKLFNNGDWIGDGIAYGPFRDGQEPGGVNPSIDELREDLHIINKYWDWIRIYGSRGISEDIINIIIEDKLNLKVMLGAWIGKVDSDDGIKNNIEELNKAIYLGNEYPSVINSINIGNETLVFWSDHRVPVDTLSSYLKYVKNNVSLPITTADDFNAWNREENKKIADLVDFIVLHVHPLWAGLQIEGSVDWTRKIYNEIKDIHKDKLIVIGETGWATQKHNQGLQAKLIKGKTGEVEQEQFILGFKKWADKENIPYFLFEVFDENWKGGDHPNEVEKHWGLFKADRTPKLYMKNYKSHHEQK